MVYRVGILCACLCIILTGCYVNRASIDPFAYAPDSPCSIWSPDSKGLALSCEDSSTCVELPPSKRILSLSEVLDIALINSPQTRITWAQARQAAAQYGISQASAFPTIEAKLPITRSRTAYLASQVEQMVMNETVIASTQTIWGPRAEVSWTIFDFGQRRFTSEAARYSLYFADFTHNQALQTLLETITLNFYSYLYQQKQLEANEADLANAEETLQAAELGLKTGAKNVSDVLQARTQALLAEMQLSQQQKNVSTAYALLLDNMGLPANALIQLQKLPFVDPEKVTLSPLEEYIDLAMQCRPSLLAARADLCSAEMTLKASKRKWTPALDYSLNIGRTYFNDAHDNYDYTSTFSLTMPIFTGFKIRNTVNKAVAGVEEAEGTLQKTELEVIKDVTTAHYNITVAFNTLKAAIAFLNAAREQYEVALSQYKQGVNTILDVVSAQTSLFDARARQAQATEQWFTSLATLTYSTGTLSHNPGCTP